MRENDIILNRENKICGKKTTEYCEKIPLKIYLIHTYIYIYIYIERERDGK